MAQQMPSSGSAYPGQLNDTVFVVDDDPLVLRHLSTTLTLAGFSVVKFSGAAQFLQQVTEEYSGCLLTDINMPDMNGLELQEELTRRNKIMSVIIMSGHADVPQAVRAMKAGALEILQKPFSHEELVLHVQTALSLSRQRLERASGAAEAARRLSCLTQREREVLDLVTQGQSNKEIARTLEISPRTVEVHRARLMDKLGVSSVAEMVHLSTAALAP